MLLLGQEKVNYMEYVTGIGIWYPTEIKTIEKKKTDNLQPVYEAFINAWEACEARFPGHLNLGDISISLYVSKDAFDEKKGYAFDKLVIKDNGIGIDKKGAERLINLRDNRKSKLNKGTGRVQYLHFFDRTHIDTVYKERNIDGEEKLKEVVYLMSKSKAFLENNAILGIVHTKESEAEGSGTVVTFTNPLSDKDNDYYRTLTISALKNDIVRHFLPKLCDNKDQLPKISLVKYVDGKEDDKKQIDTNDIPNTDKESDVTVGYSKLNDKRGIEYAGHSEIFKLRSFVLSKESLVENGIYMVSKGELISNFEVNSLEKKDVVDGNRYLFLLSGSYFDDNTDDNRENIKLIDAKTFRKEEGDLFPEEVILMDDIKKETNTTIDSIYEVFKKRNEEKVVNIERLQKMFLLNPKTIDAVRDTIKPTDSDSQILQKVYRAETKRLAENDSEIKKQMKSIEELIPSEPDYQEQLQSKIDEFVTLLPLQNRTALAQYVARRKMVLDLFDKILAKELERFKNGGRIDEKILHNLIFQQSSSDAQTSDLWLINEDFIYFSGFSEQEFINMKYNGKKIFDKEFTEEDKRYLKSLGEDRLAKRPDVLLLPSEGKCIIIEFKAPDVNVADHISQVDFYASLLHNYAIDELKLNTFYGYLIGESIEDRDVRGRVSRFRHAYHMNYWFRPTEDVTNFNGLPNGNIYMEIMKYSTLLERAKLRNKIFIDKLMKVELAQPKVEKTEEE